jgi:predicted negative regulator of RcsB-dependent stress response
MRVLVEESQVLAETLGQKVLLQYGLGYYLYRTNQLDAAEAVLHEALGASVAAGLQRGPIRGWLTLAMIEVERSNAETAQHYLLSAYQLADTLQHARHLAEIEHVRGHIALLKHNTQSARTAFSIASDLFERLGLRRELAETRAELQQLQDVR